MTYTPTCTCTIIWQTYLSIARDIAATHNHGLYDYALPPSRGHGAMYDGPNIEWDVSVVALYMIDTYRPLHYE